MSRVARRQGLPFLQENRMLLFLSVFIFSFTVLAKGSTKCPCFDRFLKIWIQWMTGDCIQGGCMLACCRLVCLWQQYKVSTGIVLMLGIYESPDDEDDSLNCSSQWGLQARGCKPAANGGREQNWSTYTKLLKLTPSKQSRIGVYTKYTPSIHQLEYIHQASQVDS